MPAWQDAPAQELPIAESAAKVGPTMANIGDGEHGIRGNIGIITIIIHGGTEFIGNA